MQKPSFRGTVSGPQEERVACALEELDLSPTEQQLVTDTRRGELCDLRRGEKIDATQGNAWGDDRAVRAEVVAALATSDCEDHPVHYRGLRLRGARITGTLDLTSARMQQPLRLDECYFDQALTLAYLDANMISLTGSCVPGVDAACLVTVSQRGSLVLDRLVATEVVTLRSAHIGGQLSLLGAHLQGSDMPLVGNVSLYADWLIVDGGMYARPAEETRFTANWTLWLYGAHIGGDLDLGGADLRGGMGPAGHVALLAEAMTVEGSMFARAWASTRLTAVGQVRLLGAHVKGQLSLSGADLEGGHGTHGARTAR